MSTAISHPKARVELVRATNGVSAPIPWYLWIGVLAVTSASIGGAWDVAWHRSIGRDTFWTPAHMAIYACGVMSAVVCTWFIVQCTFRSNVELRASSVAVFGLRAPLGVFLAGWGGIAMLTSAPFDNWWHNAYGLDVKIVSPPHALLILGARAVSTGMLFLTLASMNRAAALPGESYVGLQRLFLYLGGLTVGGQMFFLQEFTTDPMLHQTLAYASIGIAIPVVYAMLSQASRVPWAATFAASVYTCFIITEILVLPLAPAHPMLGPVFYQVTHLVPAKFPILLLVPAVALDVLWRGTHRWKLWQIALISGPVFVAALTVVEWPFANFLMSHASENRLFGTIYFGYNSRPASPDRLRQFLHPDHGSTLLAGLLLASLYAAVSTWIGFVFGRWMRTVQR